MPLEPSAITTAAILVTLILAGAWTLKTVLVRAWYSRSQPVSESEKKTASWFKGHGSIMWGPTMSRAGGVAEMSDDVAFALEEYDCEIESEYPGAPWFVIAKDGRRFTVPPDALVSWTEPALATPVEPIVPRARTAAKPRLIVPPVPSFVPPLDPFGTPIEVFETVDGKAAYRCPKCQSGYTKEVEAFICSRRDAPGDTPPFVGGDCKLCGYPRALHDVEQAPGACSLKWSWPHENPEHTVIRYHVELHKKGTPDATTP